MIADCPSCGTENTAPTGKKFWRCGSCGEFLRNTRCANCQVLNFVPADAARFVCAGCGDTRTLVEAEAAPSVVPWGRLSEADRRQREFARPIKKVKDVGHPIHSAGVAYIVLGTLAAVLLAVAAANTKQVSFSGLGGLSAETSFDGYTFFTVFLGLELGVLFIGMVILAIGQLVMDVRAIRQATEVPSPGMVRAPIPPTPPSPAD